MSPTDDNQYQTAKMKEQGVFLEVHDEVGDIIVATINVPQMKELVLPDGATLGKLIRKET